MRQRRETPSSPGQRFVVVCVPVCACSKHEIASLFYSIFSTSTDPDELLVEIQQSEPLITESRTEQVRELIHRLQQKQAHNGSFSLHQEVHVHLLPLTNVAFNKSGSKFITGSYDRRCRVWDTTSGQQLLSLEGHTNIVAAVAFNNPYGDKIATGSFDRTCKLWCAQTGSCLHSLRGHSAEIRCLAFNPQSTLVATGSMDASVKLWDVKKGKEVATLKGHSAEILSLCFNSVGSQLVTGSSDQTVVIWDVASESLVHMLVGHTGEISNAQFNWDCSLIVSGSLDKTCKVWEAVSGRCVATLVAHTEEVLDVCFDSTGQLIATASADEKGYKNMLKTPIAQLSLEWDLIPRYISVEMFWNVAGLVTVKGI
ncbi:dynein assembly factor with WDR repeat domains 1 isoform X4 [Oryzias melastigma]|uniref:dynein assembly factor with WDR repeat domains 1 isoform X4 n=1 Tax=Oryzias melastigma TaxID=30732 RepID=UPI00168CFBF0|nr:dynein assembly factor with WDR repeat domains 1 isoform X4 [Oryzias melastigma]